MHRVRRSSCQSYYIAIAPLIFLLLIAMSACQASPSLLTGTVRDAEKHSAIVGARIRVEDRVIATDADGRYLVPLEIGRYRVTVSASGYVVETFEAVIDSGGRATHDVVLTPRRLRGRVMDASDERPIAGAQVRCGPEVVTTDDEGLFDVRAVALADLSITCPGCLPLELVSTEVNTLFDERGMLEDPVPFTMRPRRLSGIAREPDGTPIQGATISVGGASSSVTTDADGRFELYYVSEAQRSSPKARPIARRHRSSIRVNPS